jgi:DNA-binding CsgD family transcriptional regulator
MNNPIDLLQRHFGLAPAEARLAFHLVAGETLRSAAVKLSISYETARTCLKKIFNKTGTCRQAGLVVIILTALPDCLEAPTDRAPQRLGSNEQISGITSSIWPPGFRTAVLAHWPGLAKAPAKKVYRPGTSSMPMCGLSTTIRGETSPPSALWPSRGTCPAGGGASK